MQSKLLILRKEKKLSQKVMAKMLDISPQSYSHKENGKKQFTANEMFIIADDFGLKVDDIFIPTKHQNGVK